jgi:NAD(P)-dependent dehydrogenase (short-subunit alcohol dehydrogenase family)
MPQCWAAPPTCTTWAGGNPPQFALFALHTFILLLNEIRPYSRGTRLATFKGTIFLTGASGGLGTAIVDDIVSRPELSGCHDIYTVRDAHDATALNTALRYAGLHPHQILSLNLSNLANVRQVAVTVNARVASGDISPIRALILNAAHREYQGQKRTESGLGIALATNYLGPWLLVLLLLESMDQVLTG